MSNRLVKTTEAFLLKHLYGVDTSESGSGSSNKSNKSTKNKSAKDNTNNEKHSNFLKHKEKTELLSEVDLENEEEEGKVLFISLSGGVDSMVLSKILKLLITNNKSGSKLKVKQVIGIHIDYANRPESCREAAYVAQWCEELGIDFRVRVINEVTRGITSRDEYEKVARDIRYQFYQEVVGEVTGSK
eukprot:gene30676-37927_t